ncbi:helix-hairpin-helix domain-containing protein [Halolamina salifodinae]|uniref:Putative flap endonuclease-1-like 5' DNA nuclease n=1 Tax=Halolamina salifodinae TaxID=1202767 RepID=A0A8T4GRU9_9EURY|nr:helix-hairpin-helix domain-containing protein [Halolamina salifodinae]MBP1985569.1 putative flap endonuclease-1-like 5' DNA nuclease [Halolamina salifodinae]
MVLRKLKRLLGLGTSEDSGRSERDVTVKGSEADAETEAAVKGVDTDEEAGEPVAAGTDADASTESLVDEEEAQAEASGRAEPAEAAGPDAEDESTDVEEADVDVDQPDAERTVEDEIAEAKAEEAAAEAEADGEADTEPVDEIKGIGPAYSERLGEIGVETVADLAGADAADVAERTTVPEKTVRKWIDRASDEE